MSEDPEYDYAFEDATCPECEAGDLCLTAKEQPNGGQYPVYVCGICWYESVEFDGMDFTRLYDKALKDKEG